MSIRNAMWAIGVLATLGLGGCMLDASGSGVEDEAVGAESAELGLDEGVGIPPGAVPGDAVVIRGNVDPGDDQGEDEVADDEPEIAWVPADFVDEVADPHPDPWMSDSNVAGHGKD